MAIIFPPSPTLNDVFTAGDRQWKWNGTSWQSIVAGESDPTMGGDLSGTASTAQIAADAVGSSEIATGAVGATEIASTIDLSSKTVTLAAGEISASEMATTLDLSGKTVTLPAASVTAHVTQTDTTPLEDDIALLGFKVAANGSLAKYDLMDQTVDVFESEAGIDTSSSSNEIYDSTGKYYCSVGLGSNTLLTQPVTGSPVNSGDWSVGGFSLYSTACFDSATTGSNCFLCDGIGAGAYLGIDWGEGVTRRITQIGWFNQGTMYCLFGEVHWSNDGTTWTTITPATGAGGNPTSTPNSRNYSSLFNNTGSTVKARYWRMVKTNGATNGAWGSSVQWYETPDDVSETLSLVSNATTARSEPTTGDMVMTYSNAYGTASLNVDLIGSISRDNGTTYTAGTLLDRGTVGSHKLVSFHGLDIDGQPSGSEVRYKIALANQALESKETRIHAVSLGWS